MTKTVKKFQQNYNYQQDKKLNLHNMLHMEQLVLNTQMFLFICDLRIFAKMSQPFILNVAKQKSHTVSYLGILLVKHLDRSFRSNGIITACIVVHSWTYVSRNNFHFSLSCTALIPLV